MILFFSAVIYTLLREDTSIYDVWVSSIYSDYSGVVQKNQRLSPQLSGRASG